MLKKSAVWVNDPSAGEACDGGLLSSHGTDSEREREGEKESERERERVRERVNSVFVYVSTSENSVYAFE